jgi:hypothetical protein
MTARLAICSAPGSAGSDFFVAKVSKEGRFLWVRSLGGSLVDRGYGVATDSTGNAYVTGHFQSTDAQANGQALPNAGDYDVFVAKYDPAGTLLWIKTAGGKGYDYGHGIVVDSKGDIVVTGAVAGEAKFGDVTVNAGSTTRPIFCAKYDAAGKLKWVKTTGGKFSGSGHGIGVDGKDAIYIGGSGGGVGSIGSAVIEIAKGQAGVVLKLTPEGEGVWAATLPGVPSAGFHEITVDSTGRTWCAGMFKGELNGGPIRTTGDKDSDGVLAHFSPEGKLVWSHVIQGPATDYCLGVATDNSGRCFVTGEFSATASFAGQTLTIPGCHGHLHRRFERERRGRMAASERRNQGRQRLHHGLAPLRKTYFFRFLWRTCDIRRPEYDLALAGRRLTGRFSV